MLKTPKGADIEPQLEYAMSLINNMEHHIREGCLEVKRELIGVMFPEKFEFDGETYRTNSYNKVLDVIYLQTNELRGQKRRDSSDFSEKSLQVPPQGLDCATCSRQSCARLFTPSQPPWKGGVPRVLAQGTKKREELSFFSSVPPQGLEPWTPTLRVSCSTN